MKKHPVDDLFKKRLASLEKQPSELAWERIQQGQKNKSRRIAAWVWYAAASVSMVLISGYVVWQNQNDTSGKLSNRTEMASVEKNIPEPEMVAIPKVPKMIDQKIEKADDAVNNASERIVQNSKVEKDQKIPAVTKKDQYQETRPVEEKSNHADIIQVAVIHAEKPEDIKANKTETEQIPAAEKVNAKSVELARADDKKADRTIVVEIEEPKNEFKDKKPSRLARVFRQLKNVREAEPVDWDDVGFNPKNILARVDDRPNTNDEKVSGKRERKN